jgi:hypothetical protein
MRNYKLCFELGDTVGDIIIEKHKDKFEIIFTNEYTCYISDYQGKYCLVQHEDNRGIFDAYFIPYEELGVKNLDELFQLLVLKPRETMKTVTENDIPIWRLIIEYDED